MQQDAQFWARDSLPPEMLVSVRNLNRRFLDLLSVGSGAWMPATRGVSELTARLAPLSTVQRAAAADCPYALFDLRFNDDRHWQTKLRSVGSWGVVSDDASLDSSALEFTRLALFFAWHTASSASLAPRLLLGMSEETAVSFRRAGIDCLPALAATEMTHLTARWNRCARFWQALTDAASNADKPALRRIQLSGLQLAASAVLDESRNLTP